MRIMKKSLAMLLALTMVLSLVAINVVAGDENTVKVEQNLEAVLRSTTVDQDVEVEILHWDIKRRWHVSIFDVDK